MNRFTRSIFLFALLSILGLVILILPEILGSAQAFGSISVIAIALLLLLVGLEFVLGALRIYIFTPEFKFSCAWRANLAGLFLSYATPFQAGGAAGQIFVLRRAGVPIERGLAISFMHLFGSLFALLPLAAYLFLSVYIVDNPVISTAFQTAATALLASLLLMIFFLFMPERIGRLISAFARKIAPFLPGHWIQRTVSLIAEKGLSLADAIVMMRGSNAVFWNILISLFLLLNKLAMGLIILYGMGYGENFIAGLVGISALLFLQYVSPTPGGSLLSEAFVLLILPLISKNISPFAFALLWRSAIAYIPAIFSGLLVARDIAKGLEQADSQS